MIWTRSGIIPRAPGLSVRQRPISAGSPQTWILLVQHPGIARERTEISSPVRLYRSGSHLIIYRMEAEWLQVLRIVHARQNWAAYLNE